MWAGISRAQESVRCWWEGPWWPSILKGFTDQEIWTWFPIILIGSKLKGVLRGLGFEPSKSRYFRHPQCSHLFLEFPRGPVEIGEEFPVFPDEIEIMGRRLRLLSPTDSVKDRLAGYIHWNSRANFEQAVLICRRQSVRVDMEQVRRWCEREGGLEAFEELARNLEQQS